MDFSISYEMEITISWVELAIDCPLFFKVLKFTLYSIAKRSDLLLRNAPNYNSWGTH